MSQRYLNFFTDYGFKRLFGSEPTKSCLVDFLNGLLEGKESPIVDLEYKNTEHLGSTKIDRKAIFDLYCTTADGTRIIVELQKAKQQFFKDRALFYSTFPIQEQAKTGNWNFKLSKVYTVAILDFAFDDDATTPEKYLYDVKLTEQETKTVFHDKLSFIYLTMPRFNKTRQQLKTQQDKWFYAIKNLSELDSIPEELKQDIFERFFQAAEVGKLPPGEKQRYEQSLKYYRDLNNVIDTAFDEGEQKGIEKGLEQGIEQGIEKGLEQGIEQGIERGIEQGAALEKSNIAKAMLKNGLSVDQVVSMTGLTKQQIESL